MAKQNIGIGSSANDGTGDTLRDAGVKLNSVIDEVYERLGNQTDLLINIGSGITEGQVLKWSTAGNAAFVGGDFDELTANLDVMTYNIVSSSARDIIIKPDSTGDIKFWGGGSGSAYTYIDGADGFLKYYAPYTDLASLPDAVNQHGMFAHVHATGKGYFAHGGAWVPLVDETSSIGDLADVDMTVGGGPSNGQILKWNSTSSKFEPANDDTSEGGGGGTTQNLFETFSADTGSTTASAAQDTLTVTGGTNISTSISGDVLTINMTGALGDPDQNLFSTIGSDSGSKTANSATTTINIIGGTGISTAVAGDNLTITNDSPNVPQTVIQTVSGDTGSFTSSDVEGGITIAGGTNISTVMSGSTLTINNTAGALPSVTENQNIVATGTNTFTAYGSPVLGWSVSGGTGTGYLFDGPGVSNSTGNPTIYVYRGFTYRFNNTTGSGHPFEIRVGSGGSAVTDGISGSTTGVLVWEVPMSVAAGTTYVYQCTIHGSMVGNLVVV